METRMSMCRACTAYCPVEVTIDDGRVIAVAGDRAAPLFGGFTCPKGRALPSLHNDPDRLLTSMKRMAGGSYAPIPTDEAIGEITDKLAKILERHGPRAIAGFIGSVSVEQVATAPMVYALMRAIGSPMVFSMSTLDQPNTKIADALHGMWEGGRMRPETLDVFLIVGGNPVISKQYFGQNPGSRLKSMTQGGADLIVIDPRRTETARRAKIHLQPIPGEDPTIIAGLVHLVIGMGAVDAAFIARNASGLAELTAAVAPFTPAVVASRAGIEEDQLRAAAGLLARARRANCGTGTGTAMATRGTLTTYLLNCLQTLRGFWAGEGEELLCSPVLLPPVSPKAQPRSPTPATGFGEKMRVRGLTASVMGLPGAALAEEILTPGEGQIRGLFIHAGLMRTMPQEALIHQALRSLDLSVTFDTEMSPTSRVADYVLASKLAFEIPALSFGSEMNGAFHPGYGFPEPFGAFHPALVEPPEGADVVDAWRLYYRLAQKLGLELRLGGLFDRNPRPLDMTREPETEEIYARICEGSAVPFDRLKAYPHGHVFEEARVRVGPRDPACGDRLDLANSEMMAELRQVAAEDAGARRGTDADYPLLFIPRRMQNVTNGARRLDPERLGTMTNPAFLHPSELASRGLSAGDLVRVASRNGWIDVVVEPDSELRPGVVAITHGFGRGPDETADPRQHGANVNRLTRLDEDYDPISGMPRMGAIPVSLTSVAALDRRPIETERAGLNT